MAQDANALDCLFGPYDFLDTAQPMAPRPYYRPPMIEEPAKRPRYGGEAELQDKADRCRARNREHARQTRRRKKEFVENLQVSVQQLSRENEIMAGRLANLDERAQERERRAKAVEEILALRVRDDDDPEAAQVWGKLVEPDFELKLPHTPYRSFPAYESTANGRTVSGVPATMADVKSLRVCLGALKRRLARKSNQDAARKQQVDQQVEQSLLGGAVATDPQTSTSSDSDQCSFDTECVLERAGVAWAADGSLMAPWTLRVCDDKRQVILQQRGMLRAQFRGRSSTARGEHDDDKPPKPERVAVLELTFDTVAFWQQLQRGLRPDRLFKAVPNTLDAALQPSDDARVITSASRPFVIEHVNGAWTKLCGYDPDECLGKTLAILQGPDTNMDAVHQVNADAAQGHATSALITNYSKDGHKFQNYVRVFPLVDDDGSTKISHMLGVLQNVMA